MRHSSETSTSIMGVSCALREGISKYIYLQNVLNTSWRLNVSSQSLLPSRNCFQVKMIVARSYFSSHYP